MNLSLRHEKVKSLPNGDSFSIPIYELNSDSPGPTVSIVANVHGAEIQGNAAIFQLFLYFSKNPLLKGKLKIIPMANPQGMNAKIGTMTLGRFSPVSGDNYNRDYIDIIKLPKEKGGFCLKEFCEKNSDKSWDEIKALFKETCLNSLENYYNSLRPFGGPRNLINYHIQKETIQSDIVLDLHTGPVACRYLYTPEYAFKSAQNFHFPCYLVIPHEFAGALDEASFIPWIKLHEMLKSLDVDSPLDFESFTLELGTEEQVDFEEAQKDCLAILNYLSKKEMVSLSYKRSPSSFFVPLRNYISYQAITGGLLSMKFVPGDFFKKGDILAEIFHLKVSSLNESTIQKESFTPIIAQEDGILINHVYQAGVESGQTIIQVMSQPKEV